MDLQFGQYRLRRKQREVLGPKDPLDLSARSFDILALLLSRPDEVISKTALFEAVWPGLVVEDNTLQVHISALRKALDAGMIMTVHGRGYKYAGPRPIAAPSESALENQAGGQSSATLRHVEGSAPTVVEADSKRYGPQASGISVAVLPFVSISSNSEDDFLADGLTEDMITELSRLKNFLVIASNTAFTYKGRSVDVAQVGRELQVRYVLEGSMRKAGSRVRITAQLIDTDSGTHIWAERFDREHSELFDIQDEVVRAVAASTQTQLMIRESGSRLRRASDDCWTLTMGATAEIYKMTAQSLASSEEICRRLTQEYPQWARGHGILSSAIYHQVIMAFEPATKARKDEALREAREGVALDPMDEFNLLNLAIPLMDFSGDVPEAMVLLHRILEVNPNFSLAYGLLGDTYLALGQADEAIRNAEICIRLNPRDPLNFYRYETLAKASLQNSQTERALHWANRIAALKPDYWAGYAFSAAILAGRGDLERARRSVDALRYCWPSVSISAIKAMEPYSVAPWRLSYLQNLVDAGISE